MRRKVAILALLTALSALVAGCSGVPTSSKPEKVGPVAVSTNPARPAPYRPKSTDGVVDIVSHFLAENYSTQDDHHSNAQAFLTPGAQKTWRPDTNGTTVVDSIRGLNSTADTVKLTAHKIGTINPDGTYTSDLAGDGSGTNLEPFEFTFQLKHVNDVWLIDAPPPTLVVDLSTFSPVRWAHTLYFVDLAKRHLIPDVRYSPLADPLALAQWQLSQLVNGPNSLVQLTDAVTPVLPNLAQTAKVTSIGSPTVIALPGSSTLEQSQRELLAAQLAATLGRTQTDSFQLTDGGKPVPVSGSDTTFTAADFPLSAALFAPVSQPPLMFVDQGGLRAVTGGTDLPKSLTSDQNQFAAVAVAQTQPVTSDLLVAGTTTGGRLLAGTESAGLTRVDRLPTNLAPSRPAWAPGLSEVWVGAGSQLFRVAVGSNAKPGPAVAVPINLATTQAAISQIKALRFSPEGSRIALVVQAKGGTANQLWFGTVVRPTTSANTVVEGLRQISPAQLSVSDAGWFDSTTLVFAAANQAQGNAPGIWQVGVDGSGLTSRGTDGLPQLPDAIAQAPRSPTYASVGGQLYLQLGTWKPQTTGIAPVYVE